MSNEDNINIYILTNFKLLKEQIVSKNSVFLTNHVNVFTVTSPWLIDQKIVFRSGGSTFNFDLKFSCKLNYVTLTHI